MSGSILLSLNQDLLTILDVDTLSRIRDFAALKVVPRVVKVKVNVNVLYAVDVVLVGYHYPFVSDNRAVHDDAPVCDECCAYRFNDFYGVANVQGTEANQRTARTAFCP